MQGSEAFSEEEINSAIHYVRGLSALCGGQLACPVARLQVEFRLGFRRACALANVLVARGVWEIVITASGMRGARILH